MNIYRTEFFAQCPTNGDRVKYHLTIKSVDQIPVEQIIAKVDSIDEGYHEDIADQLRASFGGDQVLTADHRGVSIETIR